MKVNWFLALINNMLSEEFLTADSEFESPPREELLQLSNWAHHTAYVLPQGRCVYFQLKPPPKMKEDEVQLLRNCF